MFRVRLRFSKAGPLRFIGHLDFLRAFQQTIRRARLPAAFSQGFNPHLLLSIALSLPLGMESVNDYADLTLESEMPFDEIAAKLNANAPCGLAVHSAYLAEGKAASVVAVADYYLDTSGKEARTAAGKLLDSKTLVIPKKTKNGIKDIDIRQDIMGIETIGTGGLQMRLSAGSARFIHPMTVAELILGEKPCPSAIKRLELYRRNADGRPETL